METPLSVRAALLLALLSGPGYGSDLARRVQARAGGRIHLAAGNVYTALRSLSRAGLLRGWKGGPLPQRGGRRRRYYELTPLGVTTAQEARSALTGLVAKSSLRAARQDPALLADRLRSCAEVSAFVTALQERS